MAQEWCHTTEAYENARLNVHDLDHEELAIILAEIKAKRWDDENEEEDLSFSNGKYEEFLAEAKELTQDALADSVWDFAEEYGTCDNGGFSAYICPYHCHFVSFDRDEEEEEDE